MAKPSAKRPAAKRAGKSTTTASGIAVHSPADLVRDTFECFGHLTAQQKLDTATQLRRQATALQAQGLLELLKELRWPARLKPHQIKSALEDVIRGAMAV